MSKVKALGRIKGAMKTTKMQLTFFEIKIMIIKYY